MKIYRGTGSSFTVEANSKIFGNQLEGKKWLCIGDSITATPHSYKNVIVNNFGASYNESGSANNNGFQAGYSYDVANGISEYSHCVYHMVKNWTWNISEEYEPDIITIALGTNDYANNCEMGTIDDDVTNQSSENWTFYGCYKGIINYLFERYGRKPMVLITPYPRNNGKSKNAKEYTLLDYTDAIIKIGEYYSIPVCDLTRESGLPIGTLTDYDSESLQFTADGLHVNEEGAECTAGKIYLAMNEAITHLNLDAT